MKYRYNQNNGYAHLLFITIVFFAMTNPVNAQTTKPVLHYTVSMPNPNSHYFYVELNCSGWNENAIDFKMPKWMPGYYQIMDYAKAVENFSAKDNIGKMISVKAINGNTWQIAATKNKPFTLSYDVKASRQFVANSYLDSTRGYIIPNGLFLYIDGHLNEQVSVKIIPNKQWNKIVTGLQPVAGKQYEFTAPDFDILYDCPILMGNLDELPSFYVNGIEHRFIGYKLGDFDKVQFMTNLKKIVEASVAIIGDIPYKQYTFIGIGPGQGGIEHLNNTTVSFNGKGLNTPEGMNRTMSFLAHEYFHHYNVKRIRPVELGPFDYDKANKTNLLWVSEGLSVYYQHLIEKRAGLINEQTLFTNLEGGINAFENNPGRFHQSIAQASYETWSDGPFGRQGEEAKKTISYYDKGPAVGLILDFAIRHATQNKKSLDDVMRLLYWQYYKKLQRGFTDAEFQQACENIAGASLAPVFEYVYTTKELDYNTYLGYAGLKMDVQTNADNAKRKLSIQHLEKADSLQLAILNSWLK
ncbi:MAG: hypothetical protein ABIR18_03970 [Chitinophagaceae bacterium]